MYYMIDTKGKTVTVFNDDLEEVEVIKGMTDFELVIGIPTEVVTVTANKRDGIKTRRAERKKINPTRSELSELENAFAEQSNIPLPSRDTTRQRSSASTRWWMPLRELYKMCDGDMPRTLDIISYSVKKMRESELTIVAPQSIVSVATNALAIGATDKKKLSVW